MGNAPLLDAERLGPWAKAQASNRSRYTVGASVYSWYSGQLPPQVQGNTVASSRVVFAPTKPSGNTRRLSRSEGRHQHGTYSPAPSCNILGGCRIHQFQQVASSTHPSLHLPRAQTLPCAMEAFRGDFLYLRHRHCRAICG